MSDTRKIFFDTLLELAEKDPDIVLLVGDLGFSFMEKFAKTFPGQFINVGASEQHMVGMAQGLALAGKKPWCYSGAIFMTMRPYEQIRACCFNNLNVKFVGTGASGFLGWTHNLQDGESECKMLGTLPNIEIHMGIQGRFTERFIHHAYQNNKPTYIRL